MPSIVEAPREKLRGYEYLDKCACTRICRVGSGSVRHDVQADGREVVSLVRLERSSHFVDLLPDPVLLFGGKETEERAKRTPTSR
jgi:hypothetical protein